MSLPSITARHWLPGRSDQEAADYMKKLVDREGTVEFWGKGRTAVRQMKRVGALLEGEGLAVMYKYTPDVGTRGVRQFGVRVAPTLYDFKASTIARRH